MSIWLRNINLLICFLILPPTLFSQTIVRDSLIISLKDKELLPLRASIDSVLDVRQKPERLLGIMEKNKYLFVPVDLGIYSQTPLKNELLKTSVDQNLQFTLELAELKLYKVKSLLYPHYKVFSIIHVYQRQKDKIYLGTLTQEVTTKKPFLKDKLEKGLEQTIQKWQLDVVNDLNQISESVGKGRKINLYNMEKTPGPVKPVHLLSGTDILISRDSRIVDAHMSFSLRESAQKFFRTAYGMRYRDGKNHESIEFGLYNDSWFYRINKSFLTQRKLQVLYGFNKWNDYNTEKHKIYDMFILDTSLSTSLLYNPLHRSSLSFGMGIFFNYYYIYSMDIKTEYGVLFHAGVKL